MCGNGMIVKDVVKRAIKFAETSGDGVWRTIKGRKIFIKEGQSVKDAVAAKFGAKKAKPATFYRGGGKGSMPRGGTAADVLKYEKDELGNADVKVEPGVDPKKIKSDNLTWLTTTKSAARNYGSAEKIELEKYKIIARDSENGVLVEVLK